MIDLSHARPSALAQILAFEAGPGALIEAGDLGALLSHQLRAPWLLQAVGYDELDLRLARTPVDADERRRAASFECLRDLLLDESPPLATLQLAKAHVKQLGRGDEQLPPEVARVLYYAVLVAAAVRLNQRITTLSDGELRQGANWALARPWLDPALRPLFSDAVERLAP